MQNTTVYQKDWILQLIEEFKRVIIPRNIPLSVPNFEILTETRKFGHWEKQHKTIGISDHLIEGYTWDVVIEVLKHEIAHQYVSEVIKPAGKHMPHGKEYKKACEIVGVHPEYRPARGPVPRFMQMDQENHPHLKKQIRKIEKLLALANSSNEHEAALAMQRANQFITKYNIRRIEDKVADEYGYVKVSTGKRKVDIWTKKIAGIIRDHFFCLTIITNEYDAKNNTTAKAIAIIGSKENVVIAEYVFHFLHERLLHLWRNHQTETGATGLEKRSYLLGVLEGFREKMKAEDQKNHSDILRGTPYDTTGALVVAEDHGLKEFFRMRYPTTTRSRLKVGNIKSRAYDSGHNEGKKLTIHKPVNHSTGNKGLLLGNLK